MTLQDAQHPREGSRWVRAILHGFLTLAFMLVWPLPLVGALLWLGPLPFIVICVAALATSALLIRSFDNTKFPFLIVATIGIYAYGILWIGVALGTPVPDELSFTIGVGCAVGLVLGTTSSSDVKNVVLISSRLTELRWALIAAAVFTVVFSVVTPRIPQLASVTLGGTLIVAGLILTVRLPKPSAPHVAIAMLTAAGAAACMFSIRDSIESPEGREILAKGLPLAVFVAYYSAYQRREDRIRGRKLWGHPATERAAQMRESGADWSEALRALEREGFSIRDRITAARKIDRLNHIEASRLIRFYQHPPPAQSNQVPPRTP